MHAVARQVRLGAAVPRHHLAIAAAGVAGAGVACAIVVGLVACSVCESGKRRLLRRVQVRVRLLLRTGGVSTTGVAGCCPPPPPTPHPHTPTHMPANPPSRSPASPL